VREGIVKILSDAFPGTVIGECSGYAQTFEYLNKREWNIVILEINIPGRSGLEILADMKAKNPDIAVIILSVLPEELFALRAIKLGASSYLTKDVTANEFIKAVKTILKGELYITRRVANLLALGIRNNSEKPLHQLLSDREYWVFRLLAMGKSVSIIAKELSLSVKTISAHRSNILKKMKLKNNSDIMHYAYKYKLIEPDTLF
jgi:Response regulator containing a CheY-like receiver domain and an HTH DNA-binding domain